MKSEGDLNTGGFLRTVLVDIPSEHDAAFNEWYDNVHLPEICKCPGYLGARRFVAIDGEPRYITLYEITTPDAIDTPEIARVRGWAEFTEQIQNFQAGLYREISRYPRP